MLLVDLTNICYPIVQIREFSIFIGKRGQCLVDSEVGKGQALLTLTFEKVVALF